MKYKVASFSALAVVCISSFFACGYIFSVPGLYTWPNHTTPVALPTSILFIILGSAVFIGCQKGKK